MEALNYSLISIVLRDRQTKNAFQAKEQTKKGTDVAAPIVTRLQRQQDEATAIARRAQWREYKQAERQRWNSQNKRRNRERSLAWYHANKTLVKSSLSGLSQSVVPKETQPDKEESNAAKATQRQRDFGVSHATQETVPQKSDSINADNGTKTDSKKKTWAGNKALYRAKQAISKFKPSVLQEFVKFIVKKTKSCNRAELHGCSGG
ncbi:hypothetical protein PoB_002308400 [Plakobranchus ocellatus]|uniref:Uncharacterized protein n=1 Tax=Plakobranchus ocellatus TaxID=259542 RepID=A0AAV3ZRT8_9GAST|nr:hypothetical protein PoB_002308400 [Plakobranchus ocellatus]